MTMHFTLLAVLLVLAITEEEVFSQVYDTIYQSHNKYKDTVYIYHQVFQMEPLVKCGW